ncbi:hypothetical protein ACFXKG_13905 [Streptomyces sp. NPDC059255]|uniref:hypothetical protein n=1 Tax=Streptomyces sp. NPDC059255 TaxID=3346793 RepID=UPI00369AA3FB
MTSSGPVRWSRPARLPLVGRFLTPRQAVTRAAARFAGPVEHAEPGATFTVGRSGAS